jgi:hypothetical protein
VPKRRKKPKPRLARLIRHLTPGQSIRAIGARGQVVKRIITGRSYVLEVRHGRKLVGYVNNIKKRKPTPKPFTHSMIARLQHSKRIKAGLGPVTKSKKRHTFTNKRRITTQIKSKKLISEINSNKNQAFSIRMSNSKENFTLSTPFIYNDGKMKASDLENLVASNMLMTLNGQNVRVPPRHVTKKMR